MKSDSELDALVAALRSDLPSERDSARLRARLSALGLASGEVLLTSTAAAAAGASAAATTTATKAAALAGAGAGVGEAAVKAGTVSWAVKAGVIAVVSATAMAGPVWFVGDRVASQTPAASSANAATRAPSGARGASEPRGAGASEANLAPAAARIDGEPAAERARAIADELPSRGLGAQGVLGAQGALGAPRSNEATANSALRGSDVGSGSAKMQPTSAATASFADTAEGVNLPPSERAAARTTLREETALIDRALSALRTGDGSGAAALLAEHRRRFPNGLLSRERERAQRKLDEIAHAEGAR